MSSLILLAACLALGVIVARWGRPPDGMVPALNWWVIDVALPAVTLAVVPRLTASASLWVLVVPAWLGLAGAYVVLGAIGRRLGWSAPRTGAVILVAGLGNTSFVGFPLLEALRGPATLPYAVVADQLGTFAALSTLGVLIAARFGGHRATAREVVVKMATFPPLIALAVGVAVNLAGGWPAPVEEALARVGATLSPIALFAVGLRLRLRVTHDQLAPVVLALGWKLAVVPLAAWGLALAAGAGGPILVVAVLEAAMAPMISAAILAEREGLDGPLANTILAIGILLAFGTVAAFSAVL